MERGVHSWKPIDAFKKVPLGCCGPVGIISSEFAAKGPKSGPDALLLGSRRIAKLDSGLDVQLPTREGYKFIALGLNPCRGPSTIAKTGCYRERLILSDLDVGR